MFRPPFIDPATRTPEQQEIIARQQAEYEARCRQNEREGPFHMIINREIMAVVLAHLGTPGGVDGLCTCDSDESNGSHAADHLINELVKAFNLPWQRVYDKEFDGVFPPDWCEDAKKIRNRYFGGDTHDGS